MAISQSDLDREISVVLISLFQSRKYLPRVSAPQIVDVTGEKNGVLRGRVSNWLIEKWQDEIRKTYALGFLDGASSKLKVHMRFRGIAPYFRIKTGEKITQGPEQGNIQRVSNILLILVFNWSQFSPALFMAFAKFINFATFPSTFNFPSHCSAKIDLQSFWQKRIKSDITDVSWWRA